MESRYVSGAELIDKASFTVMNLFKLMHEGRLHAVTETDGQEVVDYDFRKSDNANEYFRDAINIHSLGGSKDIPLGKYLEICHTAAKRGLEMARAEDATKYPFPFDKAEQHLAEISPEAAREEIRHFLFLREEVDRVQKEIFSPLPNEKQAVMTEDARQEENTAWQARYPVLAEVVAMVERKEEESAIGKFIEGLGVKQATLGALLSHRKEVLENNTWQHHARAILKQT